MVGKWTPPHKCNPRNTARVQMWLNSHLSELVTRQNVSATLLRPTCQGDAGWKIELKVSSQGKRKQPRTDLTLQQNWSGGVEEGRGRGEMKPHKALGRAASLSRVSFWAPDFTTMTGRGSGSKMNFHSPHSDTPNFNNIVSWG